MIQYKPIKSLGAPLGCNGWIVRLRNLKNPKEIQKQPQRKKPTFDRKYKIFQKNQLFFGKSNFFLQKSEYLNLFYLVICLFRFCFIFVRFFLLQKLVSGRFDTSGPIIPLLVPEISPWIVFVTGGRTKTRRNWIFQQLDEWAEQ